jgi:hypothetical protein
MVVLVVPDRFGLRLRLHPVQQTSHALSLLIRARRLSGHNRSASPS